MKKIIYLRISLFLFILLIINQIANAQDPVKTPPDWGDNALRAKENYTLFQEEVGSKKFHSAKNYLVWLLNYKPDILKRIYQDGIIVYEALVSEELDEKLKTVYQDSALLLYDMRIKHFGEEPMVLNRKGGVAMSYWGNRPEKQAELYDLYKRIYELNGDNTFFYNIQYYMYLAVEMKKQGLKDLNDEKLVELHSKLMKTTESNIAKNDKNKADWEKVKPLLDLYLENGVKVDCDFVKRIYTPKFQEHPRDTVMLEKIAGLMLRGNCTEDPFFKQVSTNLVTERPSFKGYKYLAEVAFRKGDFPSYEKYMELAFKYGGTSKDKAEFRMNQAYNEQKKNNFPVAKAFALKAVQEDASFATKAYTFIGDLYMNSANICKGADPKNPCQAKAIYIAAYNWYMKAGNTVKANLAKNYFPTKEEIFTYDCGGKTIKLNCWVDEIITIPELK